MRSIRDLPDLLTVEEAAAALRISRSSAYELTMHYRANPSTGLPVIRLGRRLRVPRHSLEAMLDSIEVMGNGFYEPQLDDQRLIES